MHGQENIRSIDFNRCMRLFKYEIPFTKKVSVEKSSETGNE